MKGRNERYNAGLAMLIVSVLSYLLVGHARVAQAAAQCEIPELSWENTEANDPLVAPGTRISFSSRCVGASETPFKVQVADGAGNKMFLLRGLATGSGDLASATNILIPVRGAQLCVTVGGAEVCKQITLGPGPDTNTPPRASFESACTALTCNFSDRSSDPDVGGSIQSHAWDFDGDGTVDSTEKNPSHSYQLAATYDVRLTVTDDQGTTTSTTRAIAVNSPPNAAFQIACDDLVCTFSDTSTDQGGSLTGWAWDVDGDGSTDSHDRAVTHSYPAGGTYEVGLTVTDDAGATGSTSRSVTVLSPLAIETTSLPSAKKKVAYSAKLEASGGSSAYLWSLTSGALPAGLSLGVDGILSGTPRTPGSYSVVVQVSDQQQPEEAASRTFTILVAPH